ncbi:MAG: glucuronate isomerase [Pirellulaceae bacterium]|nr:glucuronate isomerase [Pirellulaceae bacterium]
MTTSLASRIHDELKKTVLIDPHSHINPHSPASQNLADLLGYHYYTELAHSAGMPREQIEPNLVLDPREKVSRLMKHLGAIDNTVQWSWMLDLCRELFDWTEERIDLGNWERLYDQSEKICQSADWEDQVLKRSGVESIFLTNDFDDPLQGFDLKRYVPCLRADDLVFHLAKPTVVARLEKCTTLSVNNLSSLTQAISYLFDHFSKNGVRACAISLPPDFSPSEVSDATAENALATVLKNSDYSATTEAREILSRWTFWALARHCAEYQLPFDLMIGVNRQVYPGGVFQGQDLFDSRVSMIQYAKLFNAFPSVTFPISVLASVTNQELVDYSWIFPNVVTNGHWWYSNTPSIIYRDLSARIEAIPRTKQIGYYSDAYKLEFILPKFSMYRRILARVLAEDFAIERRWSEDACIALGNQILRGNVEHIFGV